MPPKKKPDTTSGYQPRVPRQVRMNDDEWYGSAEKAEAEGYKLPEVIRILLREWRAGRIRI